MAWGVKFNDGARQAVLTMLTSHANQINAAFLDDLTAALDAVEAHRPTPVSVIITARGKVFSAGLDLFRNFNDEAYTRAFIKRYEACMRRVFLFPALTVAVLNGYTVAGGCVLALACDFRVAVSGDYMIGVDEVLNNVPFPKATNEIVKYALSAQAARKALLLGTYWQPAQALSAGVVDYVESGVTAAMARAKAIAKQLPHAALFAYCTNKAYLTAPSVAAMAGETYDGFVAACYTPEAQARFEVARQRMKARKKRPTGNQAEGGAGAGAGAGAAAGQADILREVDGVVYQVLSERHVEATIAALIDVWVGHNVIMQALDVTKDEFMPLARKRVVDAAARGLSLVALAKATSEVVGFFLWEDMAQSAWGEKLDISSKFDAQFQFMTELEGEYIKFRGEELSRGQVMHGIYGGTRKGFTGRQVVTNLLDASADLARRKGYTRMVTEAVVVGSQFVSFKLGWRDIALKQYTNFEHKGSYPFAQVPIKGKTPCAVLFELRLDRPRSRL